MSAAVVVKSLRLIVTLAGETVEVKLRDFDRVRGADFCAIDIAVRCVFGSMASWTTTDKRSRIVVWKPVPKEHGGGVELIGIFSVRTKEAR